MNNKIHEAFQQIHAEESLKNNTKIFLREQQKTSARQRSFKYGRAAFASLCMLFLLIGFGSWRFYFTSAATIIIDVNPSLELNVNRFNRVIDVTGYNTDGEKLADSLRLKHMDYNDAIETIVQSNQIQDLLSEDDVLTITVAGKNEHQCNTIYSNIKTSAEEHQNTYCYKAEEEDLEKAHHLGLSSGRYQALLKLQSLGYNITEDEIKTMTMKEIHDLIHSLSGNGSSSGSKHSSGSHKSNQNTSGSTNTHRHGNNHH